MAVNGSFVAVIGIGEHVNEAELNYIASAPADRYIMRVRTFYDLASVEEQLQNRFITGRRSSFIGPWGLITSDEEESYVLTSVHFSVCLSVRRITKKVVNGF